MKDKTLKELWRYCYGHARQINSFLRTAKVETEAGNTDNALWNAMEASAMMDRVETGYSSTGSVYVYKLSHSIEFDVYKANGNRYVFIFPFGDNTPENNDARKNRREWQEYTQLFEEKAEADRKRARIFDIVATVSDEAITHIYNSATVWAIWDKQRLTW